ncbi:MAG: thioredoxin [Proteobacteria bacterium]|nr:MAG: thioredoxin [Pseudomonadota bacterium]
MRFSLLLMIALVFSACSDKPKEEQHYIEKLYKRGDVIVLKGVEGGVKKLKRLDRGFEIVGEEDKILMLDFFGTFCPPCQKEASALTALQIDFSDKMTMIGLTSFEEVSDKYVVENFSNKYGAHYFIANSKKNARIAKSVLEDIAYLDPMQLPFKVVLKNGKYQILKDVWYGKDDGRFYIGDVGIKTIREDLEKLIGK